METQSTKTLKYPMKLPNEIPYEISPMECVPVFWNEYHLISTNNNKLFLRQGTGVHYVHRSNQLCTDKQASQTNCQTRRMLSRGSRKIFTEGSKFLQATGVSISKEENSRSLVALHGGNGSPYTRKVMSALRYKQIPFSQHTLMPGNMLGDWEEKGFGHIKPKVKQKWISCAKVLTCY